MTTLESYLTDVNILSNSDFGTATLWMDHIKPWQVQSTKHPWAPRSRNRCIGSPGETSLPHVWNSLGGCWYKTKIRVGQPQKENDRGRRTLRTLWNKGGNDRFISSLAVPTIVWYFIESSLVFYDCSLPAGTLPRHGAAKPHNSYESCGVVSIVPYVTISLPLPWLVTALRVIALHH